VPIRPIDLHKDDDIKNYCLISFYTKRIRVYIEWPLKHNLLNACIKLRHYIVSALGLSVCVNFLDKL